MTDYHNPAGTEESRFRGALDDVIIIPLVFVTLAANKILRFILSILMRLLDYAFPLAMQLIWLPLFAARVLGNGIVARQLARHVEIALARRHVECVGEGLRRRAGSRAAGSLSASRAAPTSRARSSCPSP